MTERTEITEGTEMEGNGHLSGLEPKVRSIVAAQLDVAPERLVPAARLGEDLCVDSLSAIELTMVLEDEFDIALPEEEVADVRTYGDVVTAVTTHVSKRAAG